MNFWSIVLILSVLLGCITGQPKFVRKEISSEGINIKWFYYSLITDVSPDIIEVSNNDSTVEIFRSGNAITDVSLDSGTIRIKLFEPYRGGVFTNPVLSQVFNHRVVIDTTATYDEYANIPQGKKE